MITTTQPKKARAASKAHTGKTDSITVKPYTVPVEWVEVTAQIPASLADELEQRNAFIQNRYGLDVWTVAISVCNKSEAAPTPASILASLKIGARPHFIEGALMAPRGMRLRPFNIRLEKLWWSDVSKAAELLEVSAPALIRAALSERCRDLREFDRRQAAELSRKGGRA